MKYRINALQYHALPILLRVTQQEMCRKINVSNNYMCRHIDDGEFRVDTALALCNAYRLPLSLFVVTEDTGITSSEIQVDENEWIPLVYNTTALRNRLKKESVSFSSVMRTTGWTRRTIDGLFCSKCPMSKLLKFCNDMKYNLGDFINDNSLDRIVTVSSDMAKENERLRTELRAANERISVLERAMRKIAYSSSIAESVNLSLAVLGESNHEETLMVAEKV